MASSGHVTQLLLEVIRPGYIRLRPPPAFQDHGFEIDLAFEMPVHDLDAALGDSDSAAPILLKSTKRRYPVALLQTVYDAVVAPLLAP